MRLFGLILALGAITGAIITVGPQPYFDMPALLVVIGGAAGYALLKGKRSQFISHFGAGAVYFGWVGFLIGIIAIVTSENWSSMDKLGPALGVALLTIFYGYVIRLITLAFQKTPAQE